jgi:hypothetical protein
MPRLRRTLGFSTVEPTRDEVADAMPGDTLVAQADSVMNRAFTVAAPPEDVWPWLVQLGKRRAGWYLPRQLERFVPRSRRGIRHLDYRWQKLQVGDVIPDYGGRDETFTVAEIAPPHTLVYTSRRGRMDVSWAIVLSPVDPASTRVQLRLRLGPVKRRWLVETVGELIDLLTIAALASGLEERASARRTTR